MPLSQAIEPLCSLQLSARPPMLFVHTHAAMHAQLGVPWHAGAMGTQDEPPPLATPPTSNTQTVPAGHGVPGQVFGEDAPSAAAPASA